MGLALLAAVVREGLGKVATAISGMWQPTPGGVPNSDFIEIMAEQEIQRVKAGFYDQVFEDELDNPVREVD